MFFNFDAVPKWKTGRMQSSFNDPDVTWDKTLKASYSLLTHFWKAWRNWDSKHVCFGSSHSRHLFSTFNLLPSKQRRQSWKSQTLSWLRASSLNDFCSWDKTLLNKSRCFGPPTLPAAPPATALHYFKMHLPPANLKATQLKFQDVLGTHSASFSKE